MIVYHGSDRRIDIPQILKPNRTRHSPEISTLHNGLHTMTKQEDIQFTAIMQLIVPQVVDRMVKEYHLEASDAMRQLYESQLYADLERESSKLWHLSPLALAELWHSEVTTGKIPYPEEA